LLSHYHPSNRLRLFEGVSSEWIHSLYWLLLLAFDACQAL
jgi:hypothetical protein